MKATESTTAPIILGKEPVPKPPCILNGDITVLRDDVTSFDDKAQTVTFMLRHIGFDVTYHRIPLISMNERTVRAMVREGAMITWEKLTG